MKSLAMNQVPIQLSGHFDNLSNQAEIENIALGWVNE